MLTLAAKEIGLGNLNEKFHCGGGGMEKLNKWQLHYLSQSLTRAKRLEKQREEVYEELYKTITYPAMRLDSTIEGLQSHATDAQAIRIIDLQRRYDKRIQRE